MLDEIVAFLKREFPKGIQTFYTRSLVDDPYVVIYCNKAARVLYNGYYQYIEILGLSDDDKALMKEKLGRNFL